MGWKDWISFERDEDASAGTRTEVVQRIAAALSGLPPDRARYVAAFGYHLGRIAHADHQLTDAERDAISRIVAQESGLPPDQVEMVVALVVHESLVFRGTEDYRVSREFNEVATYEQKLALIRCLFGLSAADDSVVVHEDSEIRRIAITLKVADADFIAARAAVREHLAVLRRNPPPP
ncbi:MAG: TerB family tellurite resistance protein [Vicinamibacterales bacterium]